MPSYDFASSLSVCKKINEIFIKYMLIQHFFRSRENSCLMLNVLSLDKTLEKCPLIPGVKTNKNDIPTVMSTFANIALCYDYCLLTILVNTP